jgi:hypothetical protein
MSSQGGVTTGIGIEALAARLYPNDSDIVRMVTRSAVAPATTTGSGWADTFAATTVADFVGSMTGQERGGQG